MKHAINKEYLEHAEFAEDVNSLTPQDIITVIIDSLVPLDPPVEINLEDKEQRCTKCNGGECLSCMGSGKYLNLNDDLENCSLCNGSGKEPRVVMDPPTDSSHSVGISSIKEPRKEEGIPMTQMGEEYRKNLSIALLALEKVKEYAYGDTVIEKGVRSICNTALSEIQGFKYYRTHEELQNDPTLDCKDQQKPQVPDFSKMKQIPCPEGKPGCLVIHYAPETNLIQEEKCEHDAKGQKKDYIDDEYFAHCKKCGACINLSEPTSVMDRFGEGYRLHCVSEASFIAIESFFREEIETMLLDLKQYCTKESYMWDKIDSLIKNL